MITDPDLVVVADETLLADASARVLAGTDAASAVFVNSPDNGRHLASRYRVTCPMVTLDLTSVTAEVLGRWSALSSVLGAVSCKLSGVVPEDRMMRAVRDELASLEVSPQAIERNVAAARRAYAATSAISIRPQAAATPTCRMQPPVYVPARTGTAIIYSPGNSPARHTGSWRTFRPVIDRDACTRCMICFVRCPDGVISLDVDAWPAIDYDNCKGCMICTEECPRKCIRQEREVPP